MRAVYDSVPSVWKSPQMAEYGKPHCPFLFADPQRGLRATAVGIARM
jgi:hypothetical protein